MNKLQDAHGKLNHDLKFKVEALNIDASCLKVKEVPLESPRSNEAERSELPPTAPATEGPVNTAGPPRRPKQRLSPEVLENVRAKIKGASYTGTAGRQLDVLLRRFDKDGSGELSEDEVRSAMRRSLKIPASVIPDKQISALCFELDGDGSGQISIMEFVEFVGAESTVSKRTGKTLLPSMPTKPMDNTARLGFQKDKSPNADVQLAPLVPNGSPRNGTSAQARPRPPRKILSEEVMQRLRASVKAASYMGHLGRELDTLFGRFDTDGSGQLDTTEVRLAFRRTLRIPPSSISDADISSLCRSLDADGSGSVSIAEMVAFIGAENVVSKRTGRVDVLAALLAE